ncbi:MAG: hypothetical protein ACI8XM_001779 [Haloarculaceae archaeon]|jgi:hypothetical protein
MSVSSPCEICNRADVEYACDRCGRLVCDRHFDEDYGFCIECVAAVEEEGHEHIPSQEDMPDGVDTYRF